MFCDCDVGFFCDSTSYAPAAGPICENCGARDEQCCTNRPGQPCDAPDLACNGGTCRKICGGANQPCCSNRPGQLCDSNALTCAGGNCVACGGTNQPCCAGNTCSNGAQCLNGTCPPPGPMCNSTLHQGGDDPETHVVQLGRTSGTTRLTFNTFNVGDVISVSYEGQQLDSSLCIRTSTLAAGCTLNGIPQIGNTNTTCNTSANPLAPGCACCDGTGVCWADYRYSGSSSTMTVHVEPNCSFGDETIWNFSLSCPSP
jgi:hypothetical protein